MSAGGDRSALRVAPAGSGLARLARHIFSLPRKDMPPAHLTQDERIRICQESMLPFFTCEGIIIAERRGWGDALKDHELLRTIEKAAASDLRQAGRAFKRQFTLEAPEETRRGAPGNSQIIQEFIWALGVLSAYELLERGVLRMNGTRFVRAPVYNLTAKLLGPHVSADTVRRAYEAAEPRIAMHTVFADWVEVPEGIDPTVWGMKRFLADESVGRLFSIGRDFIEAEIARGKARDFPAFRARFREQGSHAQRVVRASR